MAPCCWLAVFLTLGQPTADTATRTTDPRLELVEFAAAPDVVTPVGIDVDAQGRVLVVESHTHFPPAGYAGPKSDRIRRLTDADGDGRAERVETYYEGLRHTMNLAVYHDGSVFVATRSEILRLRDRDDDGKAEERVRIAHLETAGDYPHNGLSGFAFDLAGDVYFGFGENLGADYELVGTDGRRLKGGGEGGNIYRCRPDGAGLERVATGFWNPFHLAFDRYGRLFTVDNDPDSRPPCRLLHVVSGGDYGYRFRNGRRGTHPFTAWNGELPGTLPMASGTGEAPSGIVAYESDELPAAYRGQLLVTSWGDHRIDRFQLRPRGASVVADATPVVVGGENFRPVGIAIAPDGAVYFSDWVDKSYQLHGKGRVWRLKARSPAAKIRPADPAEGLTSPDRGWRERAARRLIADGEAGRRTLIAALDSRVPYVRSIAAEALAAADRPAAPGAPAVRRPLPELIARIPAETDPALQAQLVRLAAGRGRLADDLFDSKRPAEVRAAALASLGLPDPTAAIDDADSLLRRAAALAALDDSDPFLRHAALTGLARLHTAGAELDWNELTTPGRRLAYLLLLRERHEVEARRHLPRWLDDADASVRQAAVQWIGERQLKEHRAAVERTLSERAGTRALFEACLAALERLDDVARKPTDEWQGEQYVARLLTDAGATPSVRRRALRSLRPDHPQLDAPRLRKLLDDADPQVRLEAIRTLRESSIGERDAWLAAIATDERGTVEQRAAAIVGLRGVDSASRTRLLDWATGDRPELAFEALRSLRGAELNEADRRRLESVRNARDAAWRELADYVLANRPPDSPSAESLDAWRQRAVGEGSAEAGERIFFHAQSVACGRCHQIDGRGGSAGPDLTQVGRTFTLERLVESIVQPSREIAPHFVPWVVATTDGRVRTGLLVGEELDGAQRYVDEQGRPFLVKPLEIDERRPVEKSIMPDGLAARLTAQEFRDLLAYLRAERP